MTRQTKLSVTALENRDMPATFSVAHGILAIRGTNGPDEVRVSNFSDETVTVQFLVASDDEGPYWEGQVINGKPIHRIVFRGFAGDDTFTNESNRPCIAYGGDGNDTLAGGKSKDTFFGERGDDLLSGGIGADVLNGGVGNDQLHGQDGDDRLYGGYGADFLFGEAGEDSLFGGVGDDRLDGGEDGLIDQLSGQVGRDTFVRHRQDLVFWIVVESETERDRRDGVDNFVVVD